MFENVKGLFVIFFIFFQGIYLIHLLLYLKYSPMACNCVKLSLADLSIYLSVSSPFLYQHEFDIYYFRHFTLLKLRLSIVLDLFVLSVCGSDFIYLFFPSLLDM